MPLVSEDHILLLGICLCLDLAKGTNQSKIKIRKSEGEGTVGHCICVQSVMINKAFMLILFPPLIKIWRKETAGMIYNLLFSVLSLWKKWIVQT